MESDQQFAIARLGLAPLFTEDYRIEEGWEQLPIGINHLDVSDVEIGPSDDVFVLTRLESRILVYDREGRHLRSWGEDLFSVKPHGLGVSSTGEIYCADQFSHVVRKFDVQGNQIGLFGSEGVVSETGYDENVPDFYARQRTIKQSSGPFNHPTKPAMGLDGDVFVADGYGNARIHRFTLEGELLSSWGNPGSGPGEFNLPHSIVVLEDERVVVADRENDRLQLFSTNGDHLESWFGHQRPSDLAVGPDGNIYVSHLTWLPGEHSSEGWVDSLHVAGFSILDPSGEVVQRYRGDTAGRSPGSFSPHGIAVDSRGDVYLAELSHRYCSANGFLPPKENLQKLSRK